MAQSIDVTVAKEAVEFPARCVVCGADAHGKATYLRGSPVGFYGVIPWLLRRTKKLLVPAHQRCASRLAKALLFRNLLLVTVATGVAIVAVLFGLSKWQTVGVLIVAVAIPVMWQSSRPLPFEFTHKHGQYELMFSDVALAREVAALNDGVIDDEIESYSTSEQDE